VVEVSFKYGGKMTNRRVNFWKSHPIAVKRYEDGESLNVSIDIADETSYGYGKLDENGFFEYPLFFIKEAITEEWIK
jgi:hypothetical protein